MKKNSSSSNPSTNTTAYFAGDDDDDDVSGYSSDSSTDSDYYLYSVEEYKLRKKQRLHTVVERMVDFLQEMSRRVPEAEIVVPSIQEAKRKMVAYYRDRAEQKKKLIIKKRELIGGGITSSSSAASCSNGTGGGQYPDQAAVAEHQILINKSDSSAAAGFLPRPCKKRKRSPGARRKREVFDNFLIIDPRRPKPRNKRARPSDHRLIRNPNQETAAINITHHHNINLEDEGDHPGTSSKPSTTDDHMIEAPAAAGAEEDGGEGRLTEEYESYKLVFEKELTATDVDTHQHHLKIPKKKVKEDLLLTEEEVSDLIDVKGYRVPARLKDFITGLEYDVFVRLQKLGKGQRCLCYTIAKPWNDICSNAGLQEGTWIELRASRPPGSGLTFFLNKKLA